MPTAFQELCEQKNVLPEEWRQQLSTPIIADKMLLDMTDKELEEHYRRVEERAESTKEDRALIVLERAQEGRLERQAVKVWDQTAKQDQVVADQIPEMLEALRFELTNTEVHFLLRKFDATEDFDMIPETPFNKKQWMWCVGECQMLKDTYKHVNPEAFEICYETMIQNLKKQREAGMEGTDQWPDFGKMHPDWVGQPRAATRDALQPYVWGAQREVEDELMRQVAAYEEASRLQR